MQLISLKSLWLWNLNRIKNKKPPYMFREVFSFHGLFLNMLPLKNFSKMVYDIDVV